MSGFTPSAYQSAIFEWVERDTGNAFVDAAAGAGKSTTLVQAAALLPRRTKALFCAFNRHIAKELSTKLKSVGSAMECRTIHGLGRGALVAGLKRNKYVQDLAEPDGRKYMRLADDYILLTAKQEYEQARAEWIKQHGDDVHDPESQRMDADLEEEEQFPMFDSLQLASYLRKLVDFRRLTLTEPTEEALYDLADHYDLGIEFETELEEALFWPMLVRGVEAVVQAGAEQYQHLGYIDYTDMVFLPVYLNLPPAKYDWIMVDEAQDLNACQLELVLRAGKAGARWLFCGDGHQSMYAFTGADTRSVETIIRRTDAKVLPLSICYRCPTSHIELAQQVYANIEASPTAEPGVVSVISGSQADRRARPRDYFICRTTAPLVTRCFALIRSGTKAVVLGKDLGKNFVDLLKKLSKRQGYSWDDLVAVAEEYQREQERILSEQEGNDLAIEQIRDKVATLKALRMAYLSELGESRRRVVGSLQGFIEFIESFFKPEEDEDGKRIDYSSFVVLSTIHKAKGLEADRVFIERSDLLPHPAAKKDWQQEQEQNILYVALTRAKEELYFIDQSPESLQLPKAAEGSGPLTIAVLHGAEGTTVFIEDEDLDHSLVPARLDSETVKPSIYDKPGFEEYDSEVVATLFRDGLLEAFVDDAADTTVSPLASKTVEPLEGETVVIEEIPTSNKVILPFKGEIEVPLQEGRVARIAAIEVLCPMCNGLCADPATGSLYITHDLIGHTVICSRCNQACIVPLNAFSMQGNVVAREKPSGQAAKREKKGRTQKERKSKAGRKTKGKGVRQPMQLSLDSKVINVLNFMGVNKSELFEELLQQYEPFLDAWSQLGNEDYTDEEDDDEFDEE